jgi:DNA-binding transcriptional ArsR family regulator
MGRIINLAGLPRRPADKGACVMVHDRAYRRRLDCEDHPISAAKASSAPGSPYGPRPEAASKWTRRLRPVRHRATMRGDAGAEALDLYIRAVIDWSIANGLLIAMPDPHDALFRSLSDPTRRAIFERLCREGEQTVGALTAQSGVSQPAVSKHLGVLKQAGLVSDRHEGRRTHYSAQLGALAPLIDWTSRMAGFWQRRFDCLEDLLKRMDQ